MVVFVTDLQHAVHILGRPICTYAMYYFAVNLLCGAYDKKWRYLTAYQCVRMCVVRSGVVVPGNCVSVARQFLRCVLHQLAPNNVFPQIFMSCLGGLCCCCCSLYIIVMILCLLLLD